MRNELEAHLKLSPAAWEKHTGIEILDPDGWNRAEEGDYKRPLTIKEFLAKAYLSTVGRWPNLSDETIIENTLKKIAELLE